MTIALDEVVIEPGATGAMRALLVTGGADVAGVQVDLALDDGLAVARLDDGTADCAVAPATGKELFLRLRHLGGGCGPFSCNRLRALVLSLADTPPLPDGELFRCTLAVDPGTAASRLRARISAAGASDSLGNAWGVETVHGIVWVPQPPTPTATITRTPRPTATALPEEERTRRPTSTSRPTRTALADATSRPTPLATATPTARESDDDGCAVVPPGGGGAPLLFAALALLLARRR